MLPDGTSMDQCQNPSSGGSVPRVVTHCDVLPCAWQVRTRTCKHKIKKKRSARKTPSLSAWKSFTHTRYSWMAAKDLEFGWTLRCVILHWAKLLEQDERRAVSNSQLRFAVAPKPKVQLWLRAACGLTSQLHQNAAGIVISLASWSWSARLQVWPVKFKIPDESWIL